LFYPLTVITATSPPIENREPDSSSASVIAGVVVGVILVVLLAAGVVIFFVYKRWVHPAELTAVACKVLVLNGYENCHVPLNRPKFVLKCRDPRAFENLFFAVFITIYVICWSQLRPLWTSSSSSQKQRFD
jgi:hypothetical protein